MMTDLYDKFLDEWSDKWFQYVKNHPDKEWSYLYLSNNPNITWKTIQENPDNPVFGWCCSYDKNRNYCTDQESDYEWEPIPENFGDELSEIDYIYLSSNPNITWEIIQNNPDKPWNYYHLSANPIITWEIVKNNPDKPWCYRYLSENPNVTWEMVEANPDKNWSYGELSLHPNITWEIIKANPDKPWNYYYMSQNPNISWEIVEANPNEDWNYYHLSGNKMTVARENFIRRKFQEWFKRSELKAKLMANVWHPKNFGKFKHLDSETFGDEF